MPKSSDMPEPSCLRTGWLPKPNSPSWQKFHDEVQQAIKDHDGVLNPKVEELLAFIKDDPITSYLMKNACRQNATIRNTPNLDTDGVPIPDIPDADAFALVCDFLLRWWPHFIDDDLVGLPYSAYTVGIDPTLSGSQLLGLPQFNEKMGAVLNEWHNFLGTIDSAQGFAVEGEQWLSPKAKKSYQFDDWKKDSETLPYWKSWNSFFTREFKDPAKQRPIAAPDSNQIISCPNDGSLFRWAKNVPADNPFWFKDMKYSIRDILTSDDPEQQKVIDDYKLVDTFTDGYVFQTYLNPYNFHRWWVPVNGVVRFDPISIPGAYFNKLILPDFGGATTASLPYLSEVNARGLIVIETEDYGMVCCIPLGMSEVSTITFDPAMKKGATVSKGQEMGMFNYGGSSFAMLFENLPDYDLVFENAAGLHYPEQPPTASGSSGAGKYVTLIGSQIAKWQPK